LSWPILLQPDVVVYLDCATQEPRHHGLEADGADRHNRSPRSNSAMAESLVDAEPRTARCFNYLARRAEVPLTAALAEAMLIALTTDTGSFPFPTPARSSSHRGLT